MSVAIQLGIPGTASHDQHGIELRRARGQLQCSRGRTDWFDVDVGDWLKVDVDGETRRLDREPDEEDKILPRGR